MSKAKRGVRAVAMLEASKGVLSLMVAIALHNLVGEDVQWMLRSVIAQLHLNPTGYVAHLLIEESQHLTASQLKLVEFGAFAYTAIRFIEAFGLWHGMVWTEWFAFLSGAIYIPFELYEMATNFNWLTTVIFVINVIVVWYMYTVLQSQRSERAKNAQMREE